jgi:hypothetical protein
LAARDLDVAKIAGIQGHERLRLVLPDWQEYVALAFDELLVAGPSALQVARRLVAVLDELADDIPARAGHPSSVGSSERPMPSSKPSPTRLELRPEAADRHAGRRPA